MLFNSIVKHDMYVLVLCRCLWYGGTGLLSANQSYWFRGGWEVLISILEWLWGHFVTLSSYFCDCIVAFCSHRVTRGLCSATSTHYLPLCRNFHMSPLLDRVINFEKLRETIGLERIWSSSSVETSSSTLRMLVSSPIGMWWHPAVALIESPLGSMGFSYQDQWFIVRK